MVALLEKVFAGLEADGFDHTEIGLVRATPCNETLAIVDASDVARLRTDGSAIEVIDGHYVASRDSGNWLFSVAVSCARGWRKS
jgi:hypothetical protein